MAENHDLEIYKQKYETFRHFDRLRWQLLQLAVYSTAGIIAFGEKEFDETLPSVFSRAAIGVILLFIAAVMLQIRFAMSSNGYALRDIGNKIGDTWIPSASRWWRNISIWIAFFFGVLGLLSLSSILFG